MINAVGVSLKEKGKIYYFSPGKISLKPNITVIVETERGLQFGKVETSIIEIDALNLKSPLKEIIRIASKNDYQTHRQNLKDAEKALVECKKTVDKMNLPMQIMDANFTFNRDQLIFRFISENRVDFRELVRNLASIYKTRIELRQVGVRDKAREIGGIAPCGRQLCCTKYSYDFDSVSINMAKNQNIALNPTKINGVCGRLLCCLKYEDENYTKNRSKLPNIGQTVTTEKGVGIVTNINILNLSYKIDIPKIGIVEIMVK
ncbi:MAG: regulatory iron-sulfur-containing complex subunit RicT [Bacilli bacterium]